ncbi:chromosome segregation ATPase [Prauserella isguenensis]|uniref:Chromosome segregation ATPase n=1 Tax=Prauserella isguenensis TaxID=1470180 RepID=A0A839S4Q4_9PSEU|nr:metallopeptidase [Prauserella isguenensis]MBB3053081.1 chromosome segregation ATPase [Prauserella isguenensis]
MGVSQNRFRMTFAGYDREAVDRHLTAFEEQNRAMATDRSLQQRRAEALAAELADLRDSHTALRHKFDRVCRTPIENDGLSERMLRLVELAHVEAAEIVEDARSRAERTRTAADEEARRLRRRYEHVLAELDDRRTQLEAEFAERTRRLEAEAEERERAAEEKRRRLDEESARRRQQTEQELGRALAARRAESERQVRRREKEASDRATAVLAQAREHAAEVVATASARVERLEGVQRTLTARLRETRAILSAVGELTDPVNVEPEPVREQDPEREEEPNRGGTQAHVEAARSGVEPGPVVWPAGAGEQGFGAEPGRVTQRVAGELRSVAEAVPAPRDGAAGAGSPAGPCGESARPEAASPGDASAVDVGAVDVGAVGVGAVEATEGERPEAQARGAAERVVEGVTEAAGSR